VKKNGVKTIQKSTKAKRAKQMNPVVRGFLLVVVLYVAVSMLSACIKLQVQIQEKQVELSQVQEQISTQTVINEELNNILNAEIDNEYVESVARELGYGTVGELVYDNITDD